MPTRSTGERARSDRTKTLLVLETRPSTAVRHARYSNRIPRRVRLGCCFPRPNQSPCSNIVQNCQAQRNATERRPTASAVEEQPCDDVQLRNRQTNGVDHVDEPTAITEYPRFRLCGHGIPVYSRSRKCQSSSWNHIREDRAFVPLQVWEISVNLNVIDYDGNILDCANLAALCALAHFR